MDESIQVSALIDVLSPVLGNSGGHLYGRVHRSRLAADGVTESHVTHTFWVANQGRGGWSIESSDTPGVVDAWRLEQDGVLRHRNDSTEPSPRASKSLPNDLELLAPSALQIWGRDTDMWRPTAAVRSGKEVRLYLKSNRPDMHRTRELSFQLDVNIFTESITLDLSGRTLEKAVVTLDEADIGGYVVTTDISSFDDS